MYGVLWFGSILLYLLRQKKPNSRTVYFIIICKNDKLENWYHCWRKVVLIGSSVSVTSPSLERRGLVQNSEAPMGFEPMTFCDTGMMLYRLSYEALPEAGQV